MRTCQFINETFKSMKLVKFTGTGSNTDSRKGLKSGKNISVIIESGSEIELPS